MPASYRNRLRGTIDTDRRLLQRLAYEWRDGHCLQERAVRRAAWWLERIETGASRALLSLITSDRARRELMRVQTSSAWADNAQSIEVASLRRKSPLPQSLSGVARHTAEMLPSLPENRAAWHALEQFREWADRRGHNKWIQHA